MTPQEAQQVSLAIGELDRIRSVLAKLIEPTPAAPAPPPVPDMAAFYAVVRKVKLFGGSLTQSQVDGCDLILAASSGLATSWRAYCLGTSYHETGQTMRPVREKGSGDGPDADKWDDYLERYDTGAMAIRLGNTPEADGDGVLFAGAGHVQLTGAANYKRATVRLRELGILKPGEDMFKNPELARRPDISAAVLVVGMKEGWFTGKSLRHYLPEIATREQFAAARRIVNGTDRADLIAGYAVGFQSALLAAAKPQALVA